MIILCFYNALDFQLEIIFSFIIVETIKKFCFLTNHEERLRKKFYLVMSGHSGFNFKKFPSILPTLRIKTKSKKSKQQLIIIHRELSIVVITKDCKIYLSN